MNTLLSVALLKNMARSLLHAVGATSSSNSDHTEDSEEETRERRISITQFRSLCHDRCSSTTSASAAGGSVPESDACCVCLNGFEAEEEVSELSCKHFFHEGCLEKWFGNKHCTCPLCRSID